MTELLAELFASWEEFKNANEKFVEKKNKSAAAKARKVSSKVGKLLAKYRKESVAECKTIQKRKKAE
ncbi:hypothetical protein M0R36_11195 [bacterium]|nr:hypothetical protein [bacterium]